MNFLICLATLAGVVALTGPALAQQAGFEAGLTHQSEIGWTSNAEKAAGGRSDLYLDHRITAHFDAPGETIALRGRFELGGTRYKRLEAENDWHFGADLTSETAITQTSLLRVNAALQYAEEGRLLANGAQALALTTPSLHGRIEADYVQLWSSGSATFGVGYSHIAYRKTSFADPALAPLKTSADLQIWSVKLQAEQMIGAGVAMTGLARLDHGVIPESQAFGRLQASVLRLGIGLRAGFGPRVDFALGGGADIAFARAGVLDPAMLPYGEAQIDLGLREDLVLRGAFSTKTEMADPADGYLHFLISGRLGLAYILGHGTELEFAGFGGGTRSVGFDTGVERNIGAEIVFTAALSDWITLKARASRNHVSGLAPAYVEDRVGLLISASL